MFPKCAMCNTDFQYKGPQPYLLPCLHTVCSKCLETNTQTTHCSVCGRRYGSDVHVQTKMRKIKDLDEPDDKDFDTKSSDGLKYTVVENTAVVREIFQLTVEHRPQEILCTNRDDGHQAVCWCQECSELLCEHCQTTHGEVKFLQDHQITDLDNRDYLLMSTKCSVHCLPELIYDKCCDRLMCNECYFKGKKVHTTLSYLEYGDVCREGLKRWSQSINKKQAYVIESTSAVEELRSSLESDAVRLREFVQHTFTDLRILLKQREMEVLIDLDKIMSTMNTHNEARHYTLEELHASCKTAKDYMAKCMDLLSPGELHDVMGNIRKATDHCEKAEVPQVHNMESNICFSREGLHVIKSALKSFGCFLTPRSSTWQPDEFKDPQAEKISKLESTEDELNRQLKEMTKKVNKLDSTKDVLNHHLREMTKEVNTLESTKDELNRQLKEMTEMAGSTRDELNYQFEELTENIQHLEMDNVDLQGRVLAKCKLLKDIFKQFDPKGLPKGSTFRIAKYNSFRMYDTGKSALVIKCPKMVLDRWRMNMKYCHLDDNGAILLRGVHQPPYRHRFKNFFGAATTYPLASSGLTYWEVRAHLGDNMVPEGSTGLEIAICNESEMDSSARPDESSARFVWRIITTGNPNTFQAGQQHERTPRYYRYDRDGDSLTSLQIRGSLTIGVIYDAYERSLVLIDVAEGKRLAKGQVPSGREAKFPMFCMYRPFNKMEVVSGESLDLNSTKLKFITESVRM